MKKRRWKTPGLRISVMSELEEVLLNPIMIEAIREARLAAKSLYGFVGGDNKNLSDSVYNLTILLSEIDKHAKDPNIVSARLQRDTGQGN